MSRRWPRWSTTTPPSSTWAQPFTKPEELNVIETGYIHYRDVDIHDVSVRFIDTTVIVLITMQLGSVVDGQEVSNPFVVAAVYVPRGDCWAVGSMSFTRLVSHQD
jgi:hypothetical protein